MLSKACRIRSFASWNTFSKVIVASGKALGSCARFGSVGAAYAAEMAKQRAQMDRKTSHVQYVI